MFKKLLIQFVIFIAICTPLTAFSESSLNCDNPTTTLEINMCSSQELEEAQAKMGAYLEACLTHNADDPKLVEAIQLAQKEWKSYADSHCDSVYTKWRGGTIRGVMAISCQTALTEQRTLELWENFLSEMGGESSVLPKP